MCFLHRHALSNKVPAYFSKSANSINKKLGSTNSNTYKIKTSKTPIFDETPLVISKEQGFFVTVVSRKSQRPFSFSTGNVSEETDGTASSVALLFFGKASWKIEIEL